VRPGKTDAPALFDFRFFTFISMPKSDVRIVEVKTITRGDVAKLNGLKKLMLVEKGVEAVLFAQSIFPFGPALGDVNTGQ